MSRRNQVRRRRSYGRRQHEVRERRPDQTAGQDWVTRDDEIQWSVGDADGRGNGDGDAFGGYAR